MNDNQFSEPFTKAIMSGQDAVIEVGDTVLCDIDSTDLTNDPRSGGYMFGSYAVGPCCAGQHEKQVRGYGEERNIGARCPASMSFADWVRGMRGPGAAIRITQGRPGGAR